MYDFIKRFIYTIHISPIWTLHICSPPKFRTWLGKIADGISAVIFRTPMSHGWFINQDHQWIPNQPSPVRIDLHHLQRHVAWRSCDTWLTLTTQKWPNHWIQYMNPWCKKDEKTPDDYDWQRDADSKSFMNFCLLVEGEGVAADDAWEGTWGRGLVGRWGRGLLTTWNTGLVGTWGTWGRGLRGGLVGIWGRGLRGGGRRGRGRCKSLVTLGGAKWRLWSCLIFASNNFEKCRP